MIRLSVLTTLGLAISALAYAEQLAHDAPGARTPPLPVRKTAEPKKGDFITRFVKISPARTSRVNKPTGLYQFPMGGKKETIGPCGSKHIRSHRTRPYMRPVSACMFSAMAQEWRQKFCPDNSPDCQLMFGDMSYGGKKPREWPHKTHHDGQCVDVWPVRKPGYAGEVNIRNKGYDSKRTEQLIDLMRKWGAETTANRTKAQFFFNDPRILKKKGSGVRKLRAHDDHIHVCFRSNDANARRCKAHTVDVNSCPTLAYPEEK